MRDTQESGTVANSSAVPSIEYLRVRNYRALRDIELNNMTRLSAFVGPNGSGKSTLLDVFTFIQECLALGVTPAMNRRGGFRDLRTKGSSEPISIELRYRFEADGKEIYTYGFSIAECGDTSEVEEEWLTGPPPGEGETPFCYLDLRRGAGLVYDDSTSQHMQVAAGEPDFLSPSIWGRLADHRELGRLYDLLKTWCRLTLLPEGARGAVEIRPDERLAASGDNLLDVLQYLKRSHPAQLAEVIAKLRERVPRLADVQMANLGDGRSVLKLKEDSFDEPISARHISDGTIKILQYLVALHDPAPRQIMGIEEPENHLHPSLLYELAEECRHASARSQIMVATHSPYFVSALRPDEVWVLYRDEKGYTNAKRASEMRGVKEQMECGGDLGDLWMEEFFEFGYPLSNAGGPIISPRTDVRS